MNKILKFIGNIIYKWQRRKYNAILTDKQLDYLQKLPRQKSIIVIKGKFKNEK